MVAGALARGDGDTTLEAPAGCRPVTSPTRGDPRLALVPGQVMVGAVTGMPLSAVRGRPGGLSGPVAAGDGVAPRAPADSLEGPGIRGVTR